MSKNITILSKDSLTISNPPITHQIAKRVASKQQLVWSKYFADDSLNTSAIRDLSFFDKNSDFLSGVFPTNLPSSVASQLFNSDIYAARYIDCVEKYFLCCNWDCNIRSPIEGRELYNEFPLRFAVIARSILNSSKVSLSIGIKFTELNPDLIINLYEFGMASGQNSSVENWKEIEQLYRLYTRDEKKKTDEPTRSASSSSSSSSSSSLGAHQSRYDQKSFSKDEKKEQRPQSLFTMTISFLEGINGDLSAPNYLEKEANFLRELDLAIGEGANVNDMQTGRTVLTNLLTQNLATPNVVRKFLDRGADMCILCKYQDFYFERECTVISAALNTRNIEIIKLIIEKIQSDPKPALIAEFEKRFSDFILVSAPTLVGNIASELIKSGFDVSFIKGQPIMNDEYSNELFALQEISRVLAQKPTRLSGGDIPTKFYAMQINMAGALAGMSEAPKSFIDKNSDKSYLSLMLDMIPYNDVHASAAALKNLDAFVSRNILFVKDKKEGLTPIHIAILRADQHPIDSPTANNFLEIIKSLATKMREIQPDCFDQDKLDGYFSGVNPKWKEIISEVMTLPEKKEREVNTNPSSSPGRSSSLAGLKTSDTPTGRR